MYSPVFHLPTPEASTAVRFCPVVFQRRAPTAPDSLTTLPYRLVFAVATISQVIIYDTEQRVPISLVKNIHYASVNDLSWYVIIIVLDVVVRLSCLRRYLVPSPFPSCYYCYCSFVVSVFVGDAGAV